MRPTGILFFFPQRACETPTQLVQLLSTVWHRSELWLLHHANWCVCISMWTSRRWRAERGWCFQITTRAHTHTHTHRRTHWCVRACAGESEWPCVLCFGLWLFGGQCWCGLCLREWIYHLPPYRDLHPLSGLLSPQSAEELFLFFFLPFLFVHH